MSFFKRYSTQIGFTVSYFLLLTFIVCIIWGSITAPFYTKQQNIRNSHSNTNCLLLAYKVTEHYCTSCGYGCWTYKCFDETLNASYPISNGIYVNGTSNSYRRHSQHQQQQIGKTYTCFYNVNNITSVIFELPDVKADLIQLIVAFSIIGVILLIAIIFFCYYKFKNMIQI